MCIICIMCLVLWRSIEISCLLRREKCSGFSVYCEIVCIVRWCVLFGVGGVLKNIFNKTIINQIHYVLTYSNTYSLTIPLTHSLNHSLQATQSFLRNYLGFSLSRNSPDFMEPVSSLPHSQMPTNCHYPEPAQSSPYPLIPQTYITFTQVYKCFQFVTAVNKNVSPLMQLTANVLINTELSKVVLWCILAAEQ